MAADAIGHGDPLRWFEQLYAEAGTSRQDVPWADDVPNPHLVSWPRFSPATMRRALVVGCGFGDDAEWLASHGLDVTAFDISESAIKLCQARFPDSSVDYVVADLLDVPQRWTAHPFDLVVEAYTVQVLPPGSNERRSALAALVGLTAGCLLVIARGREDDDDPGLMPWPLTRHEIDSLGTESLRRVALDDYYDDESPPVRRFRATYRAVAEGRAAT